MSTILILGADGNLGFQINKEFSKFKPIAYNRKDLDFLEQDLIEAKISQIKPDVIINTAAYNNVDKCEESKKEFRLAQKINTEALRYLGRAAIKNNSVLVHYSSDYVFGGDIDEKRGEETHLKFKEKGGFLENDNRHPVNKYGLSKLLGEIELERLVKKGLKYYIIRTSKLFGPKGKSLNSKENFFDLMLSLAKNKEELDVVNEEMSCFTYTLDLAKQTHYILKNKMDYGPYHVRNSGPAIWYDAARELFKIKEINVNINPVLGDKFPRPAKRPKYSVLANSKLPDMRSWQEALKEYLSNYK
jgi:dTDP-4-dehydrorhamnose reductase